MKDLYTSLKEKGWTEEEAKRAHMIVTFGKSNQQNYHHISPKSVYWTSLFVSIILSMILSVMLVPFLITMKHSVVYIFTILFGSGFGYIFNYLLKDIEYTDPKHHIIAGFFIPALALINIYIVVNLTNYFLILSQIGQPIYDPVIISIIYVLSFMFPYAFKQIPTITEKIFRKTYKTT